MEGETAGADAIMDGDGHLGRVSDPSLLVPHPRVGREQPNRHVMHHVAEDRRPRLHDGSARQDCSSLLTTHETHRRVISTLRLVHQST